MLDEFRKLEDEDFKYDISLNGVIIFKILFKPGILPGEIHRERKAAEALATGYSAGMYMSWKKGGIVERLHGSYLRFTINPPQVYCDL